MQARRPLSGWRSLMTAIPALGSIRTRLRLLLALATVIITIVGTLGGYATFAGAQANDQLYDRGVVNVATMGSLRDAFGKMARFEMDMLVNFESPPLTDQAKAAWNKAHQETLQSLEVLRSNMPDPAAKTLIDTIAQGTARYKQGLDQLVPRLERGEILSATVGNQLMLEHRTGFQNAAIAVGKLQLLVQQATSQLRDDSRARATRLIALSVGVALAGLAVTVGLGAYLARSIRQQIDSASKITHKISLGDLRSEPIGPRPPTDELGSLIDSLQTMRSALRDLVAGVQDSATHISMASVEISDGSSELSQRTERSANELQAVQNTLEALNLAAQHNAEHSERSERLSHELAQRAQAAGHAASQSASSMHNIEAHAAKISDITAAMDGIAFQTHMLAINASIEASRAGALGRGFGVVAQEIQTLARRSASAATQIKGLLQQSDTSIREGVESVRHAHAAVQSIEQAVQQLQSEVVALRTESVTVQKQVELARLNACSVEESTLQNSALSEESAAAAHSLKDQSSQLTRLVAAFKI